MKHSLIALCSILTISALPTLLLSQDPDNVRVADLSALRELGEPEPIGIGVAIQFLEGAKRNAELDAWEVYVRARHNWALENQIPIPEVEGPIVPEFEEELFARTQLAEALKGNRRVGKSHRNYSKEIQKVIEAGFFKEYVFEVHNAPGWDASEHELRIDDYKKWASENIPDHEALTYATRTARALNRTSEVFIVVDSELDPASESAFWLRYCLLRLKYRKDNNLGFDLLIGEEAIPTFKEELAARRGLLKDFDAIQDSLSEATRTATAEMAKAESEGFLREYVWELLRQEGWEEPAELKLEEFKGWAKDNLTSTEPLTHSTLVGRQ